MRGLCEKITSLTLRIHTLRTKAGKEQPATRKEALERRDDSFQRRSSRGVQAENEG